MKILHLIYDHMNNPWVAGGGAIRGYEIYRRLSEDHQVTIVCGKYPKANDYKEEKLNFHFVGTSKNNYILSTFCYAVRAAQFLRKHARNADVVIEDFAPYNPLFSKYIVGNPSVLQIHHKEGINLFYRYFILGCPFILVETVYPRLFSNVICVSEGSRRKFKIENAAIIPNGINNRLFDVKPSDGDYIAYIGRLHIHNKGLDTAIKAMKSIDSKLIIAGRGRDEKKLNNLIKASEGFKGITLEGYLDETKKAEFLANSRFVVVPSRYEGQGIVVLEAAACGKPVIVSDIPELKYTVDAGFGISFETGNINDLAKKIKLLLENDTMRKQMGQRAREYARNYTWDRIAEEYERYLLRVRDMYNG